MLPDEGGTLIVPTEITAIKSNAFSSALGLKHLVLHPGVTTIEEYAFAHCRNLVSVDMKGANVNIGKSAFFKCTHLRKCFNASLVNNIGAWAFFECSRLESIACSATHVGLRAFDSCTGLQRFESSVEWEPDSYAFFKCTSLLTLRGISAFPLGCCSRCENLHTVHASANITEVGELAFSGAKKLKRIFGLLDVISVNRGAFYECSGLSEMNLPHVKTVGASAFGRCLHLKRIVMPEVHTLKEKAFQLCHGLRDLELGALEVAETGVFQFCLKLKTANLPRVYMLGDSAFRGCSRLISIIIPNVLHLRKLTFVSCASLKTVRCGSVCEVGMGCFSRCKNLTAIPDMPSASTFRSKSFEGSGLQSIKISTHTILDYVFSGCTALRHVELLPGVNTVGTMCFRFCPVEQIVFPDTVAIVGDFGVAACTKLKTIVMAEYDPAEQRRIIHPYSFSQCNPEVVSGPLKIFRQLKMTHTRIPKLQLYHYFWSIKRHKESFPGNTIATVVWTVYAIFERLQIPQEMAMLVLQMSALSGLGALPHTKQHHAAIRF